MDLLVVAGVAIVVSTATFFTGFGLGTVLLPVMALFMPAEPAVAATAIAHFLNSGLKLSLTRRHVARDVFRRFGVPAFATAFVGALVLKWIADVEPVARYRFAGGIREVTVVNVVLGLLLVGFAVRELVPRSGRTTRLGSSLTVGGIASGFLGGLAGLQGALRSAFLIRTSLNPRAFIATGAAIAVLVDAARLVTYAAQGSLSAPGVRASVFIAAVFGATAGTLIGNRWLGGATHDGIRAVVGAGLMLLGAGLASGFLR